MGRRAEIVRILLNLQNCVVRMMTVLLIIHSVTTDVVISAVNAITATMELTEPVVRAEMDTPLKRGVIARVLPKLQKSPAIRMMTVLLIIRSVTMDVVISAVNASTVKMELMEPVVRAEMDTPLKRAEIVRVLLNLQGLCVRRYSKAMQIRMVSSISAMLLHRKNVLNSFKQIVNGRTSLMSMRMYWRINLQIVGARKGIISLLMIPRNI